MCLDLGDDQHCVVFRGTNFAFGAFSRPGLVLERQSDRRWERIPVNQRAPFDEKPRRFVLFGFSCDGFLAGFDDFFFDLQAHAIQGVFCFSFFTLPPGPDDILRLIPAADSRSELGMADAVRGRPYFFCPARFGIRLFL